MENFIFCAVPWVKMLYYGFMLQREAYLEESFARVVILIKYASDFVDLSGQTFIPWNILYL